MNIVSLVAFVLGMLIALVVLNFSLNSHEETTTEPPEKSMNTDPVGLLIEEYIRA